MAISHQNNYKAEDLHININTDKTKAQDNDLVQTKGQYLTPNPSVLKLFIINLVDLLVEDTDSFKFEEVDCSHKKILIANSNKKRPEYCTLEPVVMTQLEKQ